MNRISARGAISASGAVSVIVSLCLLGGGALGHTALLETESAHAATSVAGDVSPQAATGQQGVGDSILSVLSASGVLLSTAAGGDTTSTDAWSTATGTADTARAATVAGTVAGTAGIGVPASTAGIGVPDTTASSASTQPGSAGAAVMGAPSRSTLAGSARVSRDSTRASLAAAVLPVPKPARTTSSTVVRPAVARSRVVVSTVPATGLRGIAQNAAQARGWTGLQWICLDDLWQRESKYQVTARNGRSGAYGIPQALPASKMASAGADWRTNPITQIQWGLQYIAARYGTPCSAWSHWTRSGAY